MIGLQLIVALQVVGEIVEVALHRSRDLPDEERRGDHRQHGEGDDDRTALLDDARDDRAQLLLRRVGTDLGSAAQLLVQGQERRHQQEGAEPAKQHADPADEAEMAESPVRGHHQHAEGDAGCGGGEQGGSRRGLRALQARLAQAHSLPAQLFETGEVDETVVDAIAHHDGAEESGLRVEVADHHPGEPEGDRDGHQHR